MTRQASGNPLEHMVRDLRPFLRNLVISFDKDDDDKDDEDDKGGDDDGDDGASGTGTDSDKSSDKSDIKDPEKKRLSDEAAAHRVRARTEKERADALALKLKEFEDKDKSELDKAQAAVVELTARAEKAEEKVSGLELRVVFFESGAAAQFKDPNDARKLLDFSTLKPNDEGEYDHKEVKALADAFLKTKPFYASDGSDDGSSNSGENGGAPSNGRRSTKPDNAALTKKFPALASRG